MTSPKAPGRVTTGEVFAERYRIEELIGQGGFGVVYRATQLGIDRAVALKLLHAENNDQHRDERFLREAQLIRNLEHPNTVRLYDYGTAEDGTLYIALQYLDGEPLNVVVERDGRFSPERTTHIAAQVLRSLMEAHALGIIHRDIKPSNIFLCDYSGAPDFVKLLDFGLAKSFDAMIAPSKGITAAGQLVGTPTYMAPEQVTAQALGPPTDLYALGLVMSEMLTGEVVFEGESVMQVYLNQASDDPVPLPRSVIGGPLGTIITKATHKVPAERYASAREMLEAMESALTIGASASFASYQSGHHKARPSKDAPDPEQFSMADTSDHVAIEGHPRRSTPPERPAIDATSTSKADTVDLQTPIPANVELTSTPAPDPTPPTPDPSSAGGSRRALVAVGILIVAFTVLGAAALGVAWFGSDSKLPPWDPEYAWRIEEKPPPTATRRTRRARRTKETRRAKETTRRRARRSDNVVALDTSATRFDALDYWKRAAELASAKHPDAALVGFQATHVAPNGRVDLKKYKEAFAVYTFRSAKKSKTERGVANLKRDCLVRVRATFEGAEVTTPKSPGECGEKILARPRCTLEAVWQKAQSQGAPKSGRVADITWLHDGWFFQIGDDTYTYSIKDTCSN